jgi:hypothetical protein
MPDPYALLTSEFVAFHAETEKTAAQKTGKGTMAQFREFSALVRQWPDGEKHDPDGLEVNLSLITTVINRGAEIMLTAANLGNLLAPPGGHYTQKI